MRVVRRGVAATAALAGLLLSGCTRGLERSAEVLDGPTPSAFGPATASPTVSPAVVGQPAVIVEAPLAGDGIQSPVVIRGTADVYEGLVSIRILDAGGQELAAINARASCGTGCRGEFRAELAFYVERRQRGTVQVWGAGGADGSPVGLVEIPVTLVP